MEKAKVLKQLQEVDLRSDKLKEKKATLPEREKVGSLNNRLLELDELMSEQKKKLSGEESKQNKIEGELGLLSLKIKKEEQKLYSGTITSPKELVDIQKELVSLKQSSDKMETELLEQLELVEELNSLLKANLKQRQELSEELTKTKRDYEEQVTQIEGELQSLKEERSRLISLLDESTVQLYKELRLRKQGVAVVMLKEGVCQGCHVRLPAEEVDKMLRSASAEQQSEQLWCCSHCERILVKD